MLRADERIVSWEILHLTSGNIRERERGGELSLGRRRAGVAEGVVIYVKATDISCSTSCTFNMKKSRLSACLSAKSCVPHSFR